MVTRKTPAVRIACSAAFLVLALALALVPAALAGKGPGKPAGGGGTGSYHVTVGPASPYVVGEMVYITTDAPILSNGGGPWIALVCYQNGAAIVGWTHAAFSTGWYYNWPYLLSWAGGGAADCTATVFHLSNNKSVTDATTSFHVYA